MVVTVRTPPQADYGTEIRDDEQVIEPENNARQGVSGHNVRTVLRLGVAGVVVAFVLIYWFFFSG